MRFLRTVFASTIIALSACVTHAAPAFAKQTHTTERTWFGCARSAIPGVIKKYDALIGQSAHAAHMPKTLLVGFMLTESLGNPDVRDGLMQTNSTVKKALHISCDERNPECSIRLGSLYFRYLSDTYHYSFERTIIAYNRGPTGALRVKDPTQDLYYTRVAFVVSTLSATNTQAPANPS